MTSSTKATHLPELQLNHVFDGGNGFCTIKNPRTPKILKFDNCNLDLQKNLLDFIKILPEFL